MKHPIALSVIAAGLLFLGGCAHNNQGNCTTDCHIGGGTTVVTPGYGYVAAPAYYPPRHMSPSLYHPYRGYGRGHGHRRGWHVSGTVIIR